MKAAVARIATINIKTKQNAAGPPTAKRRLALSRRAFKNFFKRALGLSSREGANVPLKAADIDVAFASARSKGQSNLSFKQFMGACADLCLRGNMSFQHLLTAVDNTILKSETVLNKGTKPRRQNRRSEAVSNRDKPPTQDDHTITAGVAIDEERKHTPPRSPLRDTAVGGVDPRPVGAEIVHGGVTTALGEFADSPTLARQQDAEPEPPSQELGPSSVTDMSQWELRGESVFQPVSEAELFAEAQMDARTHLPATQSSTTTPLATEQTHTNDRRQTLEDRKAERGDNDAQVTKHSASFSKLTEHDAAQFAREHVKRLTDKVLETHSTGRSQTDSF